MNHATLLFLVQSDTQGICRICLALKKRGFGVDKWNGVGGKPAPEDVTIQDTAQRETYEEIGVIPKNFYKVAELDFEFLHNKNRDQLVHVYFCTEWEGVPIESEEMSPKWFDIADIPFEQMRPDDWYRLPRLLQGEQIKGYFLFGEGNEIQNHSIENAVFSF